MSEVATVEASVAAMVGEAYAGAAAASATTSSAVEHFSFDETFQTLIAAFATRDDEFMRHAGHLIKPDYFENAPEATLVNLSLAHYQKYRCLPDNATFAVLLREALSNKSIRKDLAKDVVAARKRLMATTLANREYVEDKVVSFVRHQAVGKAILASVELLDKGKFDKIEEDIRAAIEIGKADDGGGAYDFFTRITERTERRLEDAAGTRPPRGITTGIAKMDELLYHRGWGRRELVTIMGGAKAGKTTALINFAKSASLAGHNVLYATLEVGADIIADRLDACLSSTEMKKLSSAIHDVADKINELQAKAGKLIIHEYPSGTLTPNMLRKLIERYESPSWMPDGTMRPAIKFDLIVVDYADIMAPNFRSNDAIENSKSVYVDLRAIAFEKDCAVLTATQTNRTGHTAAVAKAEHVAEDFNKVRTVDLMVSINKTEEEARDGIARLYFAASRNQESGFTIVIKQNIAMMQFVTAVLRVE